jgi:hypothetical protein
MMKIKIDWFICGLMPPVPELSLNFRYRPASRHPLNTKTARHFGTVEIPSPSFLLIDEFIMPFGHAICLLSLPE